MKNPFRYSDDNKRYHTINYYFRHKYHQKVAKIPLHAGFTCPNRDGYKGTGGCLFCSEKGSGDSILNYGDQLKEQYRAGLELMRKKWPDCLGFAYFQSFTNTYADLVALQSVYDPFVNDPAIPGLSIATRADCLDEACIRYLSKAAEKKEIWLELGLQSANEQTMQQMNRCHDNAVVESVLKRLESTPIHTCVHLINGFPRETKDDMIRSAQWIAQRPVDAVKIHMLHIIKGSPLADIYQKEPFPLLSRQEYVDVVVAQLEQLPETVIIERLTGDAMAKDLIAPAWTMKKTIVLNEIDKKMARENTWQGKYKK
ncbi:MAG: TIGR01212 family radical SAM protein [Erysipelotrichaceae bacterium]|nr:TIGR01212 family radical SAM protein [Erysipelotrichaceae bacterium]